jgi:hypothetical protein
LFWDLGPTGSGRKEDEELFSGDRISVWEDEKNSEQNEVR